MNRLAIVGGGIIGLSIAWEWLRRGGQITLLERQSLARRASWAGAGILTPVNGETAIHPLERLSALSNTLHAEWSSLLKNETGISNGFWRCGGIHLARTPGDKASLSGAIDEWAELKLPYERLSPSRLKQFGDWGTSLSLTDIGHAVWLPDEAQFCNPTHCEALAVAISNFGPQRASIHQNIGELTINHDGPNIISLSAAKDTFTADQFCFAAGPWTAQVLQPLGVEMPMLPVRGQMLLYKLPASASRTILYEGSRYIVPRMDGHVLVGSTVEEAGFDTSTTQEAVDGLTHFASSLIPQLNATSLVRAWAGLRPASYDGFPYLGRVPGCSNAWIAAGHFRNGLLLSTGTAVVMADLMSARQPSIDVTPFDPARVPTANLAPCQE